MDPAYKSLALEHAQIKATDDHTFTGYVARFGNVDAGGDVILPGAFDTTLKERKTRPLLWQHDTYTPIGKELSLKPDDNGLLGTWQISDTQAGRDAYTLLKDGAISGMSIGYVPTDVEYAGDVRKLKTVDLLESSVVTLPMNEAATIQSVKALHGDLFDGPLADAGKHITEELARFVEEAKALYDRRRDDGRELADAHIAAITALLDQAEAVLGLKSLLPKEPPSGDAELDRIRLSVALHRLARMARGGIATP